MNDLIEQIGPFLGIAAFLGLAILAFLIFQQAREVRRLREWAGRAPERAGEAAEAAGAAAEARGEVAEEEEAPEEPAEPGRLARWWAGVRERIAARLCRARPADARRPALPARGARGRRSSPPAVLTSGFGLVGGRRRRGRRRRARARQGGSPRRSRSRCSTRPRSRTRRPASRSPGVQGLAAKVADEVVKPAGYKAGAETDAASGLPRDGDHVRDAGEDASANETEAEASSPKQVADQLGETSVTRDDRRGPRARRRRSAGARDRRRRRRVLIGRSPWRSRRSSIGSAAIVALTALIGVLLLLPLYLSQRRDVRRLRALDGARARAPGAGHRRERADPRPRRDRARGAARRGRARAPAPTPATPMPAATRVTHERPALERVTMERAALAPHPRWRRFVAGRPSRGCWSRSASSRCCSGSAAIFVSEELLEDGGGGERGPRAGAIDPGRRHRRGAQRDLGQRPRRARSAPTSSRPASSSGAVTSTAPGLREDAWSSTPTARSAAAQKVAQELGVDKRSRRAHRPRVAAARRRRRRRRDRRRGPGELSRTASPLGAALFFALLAATVVTAVLVVRARTPDLVLEVDRSQPAELDSTGERQRSGSVLRPRVRRPRAGGDRRQPARTSCARSTTTSRSPRTTRSPTAGTRATDAGRRGPGRAATGCWSSCPSEDREMIWPRRITLGSPAPIRPGGVGLNASALELARDAGRLRRRGGRARARRPPTAPRPRWRSRWRPRRCSCSATSGTSRGSSTSATARRRSARRSLVGAVALALLTARLSPLARGVPDRRLRRPAVAGPDRDRRRDREPAGPALPGDRRRRSLARGARAREPAAGGAARPVADLRSALACSRRRSSSTRSRPPTRRTSRTRSRTSASSWSRSRSCSCCSPRSSGRRCAAAPGRWSRSPRSPRSAPLIAIYQYFARDLFLNPELFDANELHVYFRVNSIFFDPNILGRYLALAITALGAYIAWRRIAATWRCALATCVALPRRARVQLLDHQLRGAARRARDGRAAALGAARRARRRRPRRSSGWSRC